MRALPPRRTHRAPHAHGVVARAPLTHRSLATAATQAAAARLDALENDNAAAEGGAGDDSDDYVLADDIEGAQAALWRGRACVIAHRIASRRDPLTCAANAGAGPAGAKRKRGAKRTTRGAVAERKGPKPLSALLEEARLELLPPGVPSYLRAAVGPPRAALQRRKFCSVCGFQAPCVPPCAALRCMTQRHARRCACGNEEGSRAPP